MDQRKVAVFDIDGTVFRSVLAHELMDRMVAKGIFPKDATETFEQDRMNWLNRTGDYSTFDRRTWEIFDNHMKGVSYDAVVEIANEIVEEKKGRVYRYTRDLIKKLRKEGYFLLAISHSPRFIVEPFCFELGFDKVYGFFWEVGASGNFTGEVADKEIINNKASALERAVRKENLTLTGSIGVGDGAADIPMLEAVENPIAFNPNKELYEHAKRRKWKIVVERKDVIYEF